jgi:hypothetical protein
MYVRRRVAGGVDVEAEDDDAPVAGIVEDEPLGVHPRVVGEDPGIGTRPGGAS